jgi:hypothetical protein
MAVQVADAHVQRLVSVVKMRPFLRVYYRRAVFWCVFCGQMDSMQRIFIKKCFPFTVGSVCHVKQFTTGLRNEIVSLMTEVEMEVQKWLKQQSKVFCAAGFDTRVKQWDKCTNVGGGYVEKLNVFPGSNITCFTLYIHL